MEFLSRAQLIVALAAVALAVLVLDLVRRRRLSEDLSLLWLVCSVVIAVLGFSTPALRWLTRAFGILYESSTVFAAGLGFAIAMLLLLSVRLSRLSHENLLLARELAMLRLELEQAAAGATPPARDERGGTA